MIGKMNKRLANRKVKNLSRGGRLVWLILC